MRILEDVKLDFNDILILPHRSVLTSRSEVSLDRTFIFRNSKQNWTGTPLIAANMDTVATFIMAKTLAEHNVATALHKHYPLEQLIEFFNNLPEHQRDLVFYSIGLRTEELEKFNLFKKSLNHTLKMLCVDVPSAYIEKFIQLVSKLREENPDTTILAGNVVTAEITEALILAGADIIKVGIGSGVVCTTRKMTGVGLPQFSAILDTADAAHGLKGLICSDGGIVYPGDLGKAFGGGADFVMMGGAFAGHDECESEIVERDGKKFVKFYGMSSHEAQKTHYGEIRKYRASEGRETLIPYKGSVISTLQEYLGGLRSTMTYIGATKLKEVSKRTTFVKVNRTINTAYEQYEKK